MLFAQIKDVDPGFLKQALLLVIGILGGAGAIVGILSARNKRREVRMDPPFPSPLEVRETPIWAQERVCATRHAEARGEIDKARAEIDKVWAQLNLDRAEWEKSARTRSAGIYAKIDEFRKELSSANDVTRNQMQKGFTDLERAIGRLEGKINRE